MAPAFGIWMIGLFGFVGLALGPVGSGRLLYA
jgi:hypothetical protein